MEIIILLLVKQAIEFTIILVPMLLGHVLQMKEKNKILKMIT